VRFTSVTRRWAGFALAGLGLSLGWRYLSSARFSALPPGSFVEGRIVTGGVQSHPFTWLPWEALRPRRQILRWIKLDPARVELRVLVQGARKASLPLKDVLHQAGAIAGLNGGYFDVGSFAPSSLVVADGCPHGSGSSVAAHVGVWIVDAGKMKIIRGADLGDTTTLTQCIQCSPLLLWQGRNLIGRSSSLEPSLHTFRRSFVAVDDQGQWFLGCSSPLTLESLATLLADNTVMGTTLITALNLDGGPSSGLWVTGDVIDIPPQDTVKTLIGVFSRQ
jgi:exopolysaccharide biosynthesis protein